MSSQWKIQLTVLKAEIENKLKQISLLEQLIALEMKHGGDFGVSAVKAEESEKDLEVLTNHHSPKSQRKLKAASCQHGGDGDKTISLPELLKTIGQQHAGKKIQYKVLAEEVMRAGYNSNSKNFNNMVYQSLQKLVKRGVYTKDAETREYQFVVD